MTTKKLGDDTRFPLCEENWKPNDHTCLNVFYDTSIPTPGYNGEWVTYDEKSYKINNERIIKLTKSLNYDYDSPHNDASSNTWHKSYTSQRLLYQDTSDNLTLNVGETIHISFTVSMPKVYDENYHKIEYAVESSNNLMKDIPLWPALWVVGKEMYFPNGDSSLNGAWPSCGEIDLMEWYPGQNAEDLSNNDTYDVSNNIFTFKSALHSGDHPDANYNSTDDLAGTEFPYEDPNLHSGDKTFSISIYKGVDLSDSTIDFFYREKDGDSPTFYASQNTFDASGLYLFQNGNVDMTWADPKEFILITNLALGGYEWLTWNYSSDIGTNRSQGVDWPDCSMSYSTFSIKDIFISKTTDPDPEPDSYTDPEPDSYTDPEPDPEHEPEGINQSYTSNQQVLKSNVCFSAGAIVYTDQGAITIKNIDTKKHTLNGMRIKALTRTFMSDSFLFLISKNAFGKNKPMQDTYVSGEHKIKYNRRMIKAKNLYLQFKNIKKIQCSENTLMYNVLMNNHMLMNINGLIAETLDPNCDIAKHFDKKISNSRVL